MAAVVVFSAAFWAAGLRASVVVDTTRYHYLDDDQMISMRYARNLAEGYGPVWNRSGERVEGYTNFGWMAVMAAVHGLGAPDRMAAFWVRAIGWALGIVVLLFAWRLLHVMEVASGVAAAAIVGLAMSYDLLFWAVNGFETTLLTAVFIGGIVSAVDDGSRGRLTTRTCLLAGLLPIVRADAFDLTAAVVVTAVWLGARRGWWAVALALLPALGYEVFRVTYYGEWLPNTYYLKVAGRLGLFRQALGNLKAFAATYTVFVLFAAASAIAPVDRRVRVLAVITVFGMARVLLVGPDMFPGFRFLAPYLPVLLVSAAAVITRLAASAPALQWTMATTLLLASVFSGGVAAAFGGRDLISSNGVPHVNTVTGVLLQRHARHESTVAVAAAGCIGYFSRLEAIDLLGKNDRHVARVAPATRSGTGHNRFDIDWSLRSRPDFVATFASHSLAAKAGIILPLIGSSPALDYGTALLLNPTFRSEYAAYPVPVPFLLDHNALFVHAASSERLRLGAWRTPWIARP